MNTRNYIISFLLSLVFTCFETKAQVDKSLSNLASPTAINQSLLPIINNAKDLGSITFSWKDIYLSNHLFMNGKLTIHSSGSSNFFAGNSSGNTFVTGSNNAGFGNNTLQALTNGNFNAANGAYALYSNNTGSSNTAGGYSALRFNSTGNNNTANGAGSLRYNTTGFDNTATGYRSLMTNSTGSQNTATGSIALFSNTAGFQNTANGYSALYNNTTGVGNTASGSYALRHNTTGFYNTANGSSALYYNTTGKGNTAVGYLTLHNTTTGYYNTASGSEALYNNREGSENVATGFRVLLTNITGYENTASGSHSMYQNKTGYYNTASGSYTMYNNLSGKLNTAKGYRSLYNNLDGSWNTAMGDFALNNNTSGDNNTGVGHSANVASGDLHNATAIGAFAKVDASNKVRIGNTLVTSIGGQVGWTTFSDGRYKRNIHENVGGLAFINSLRPVSYTVDTKSLNEYYSNGINKGEESQDDNAKIAFARATEESAKIIHDGFIAQEVEHSAKRFNFEFSGVDKPQTAEGVYGLRYEKFVVPLVKAVQELSKKNDSLQQQIDELKAIMKVLVSDSSFNGTPTKLPARATLEQNVPNPFANTTTIRYTLPPTFSKAQILVNDVSGKVIKAVDISGSDKGVVNIDAAILSAGAYSYTLFVSGKVVATKQMVRIK